MNWHREYRGSNDDLPDTNPYKRCIDKAEARCDGPFRTREMPHAHDEGPRMSFPRAPRVMGRRVEAGAQAQARRRGAHPKEAKERAVVDLVARNGSAKNISDELGIERATPPPAIGSGDFWMRRHLANCSGKR